MKDIKLTKIEKTNLNQEACFASPNIPTIAEKLDFKSGLPYGVNLSPQWVTGIIDSEGNFSVSTQKTTKNKLKFSSEARLLKLHKKTILKVF